MRLADYAHGPFVGENYRLRISMTDADSSSTPADPAALTVTYVLPDATTATKTWGVDTNFRNIDTGEIVFSLLLAQAGRHELLVTATDGNGDVLKEKHIFEALAV